MIHYCMIIIILNLRFFFEFVNKVLYNWKKNHKASKKDYNLRLCAQLQLAVCHRAMQIVSFSLVSLMHSKN